MYRFQISAPTQADESIGLVGSIPELGLWDVSRCIRLCPPGDRHPLWHTASAIEIAPSVVEGDRPRIEYKYLRFGPNGQVQWEPLSQNRWLPFPSAHAHGPIVVEDGVFGYGQPYPFGYREAGVSQTPLAQGPEGLKIVLIGSSVALGHKAWLMDGWAGLLGQALQQRYGHQLINVSEAGANVSRTLERFSSVVVPEQPDIVIIALSLGNEGFAHCTPQARRAVQRRFESGLQQLVKRTRELGAYPMLGGVYPHGDYTQAHQWLLWDTHKRMVNWGVPILDWLAALEDDQGRWQPGISYDPAHPNTIGHHRMVEAIDLQLFSLSKKELEAEKQHRYQQREALVYADQAGFQVTVDRHEQRLHVTNASAYGYTLAPYWQELQTAVQCHARLMPGIYLAKHVPAGTPPFLSIQEDGSIQTYVDIPAGADIEYQEAFTLFAPNHAQVVFYDGNLGILQVDDQHLWIINESDHMFNIHPMWQEVRHALKGIPPGVYEDAHHPDLPFRTLILGKDGLESRVKVAPRSAVLFRYVSSLSEINRVAIIPLGDRCAIRMLLYKMEYDGPAFPFDLTRTTNIADVADMIENGFYDMWNPAFLHYEADAGRIYHTRWSGLSFAHEVEESDDPSQDMFPVYERMRSRYSARSERFWYTLHHCDKALFIRTGWADRGGVIDLVSKLEKHSQGKPFHLLLISPQSSEEFSDLPHVLHYDLEFNPDRMYEDLGHWMYCTEVMHGILTSFGVTSKNLFWCPPKPPREVTPFPG